MTYNLNQYDGNINPSTTEGLNFSLKATEEKKQDSQIKISQLNVQFIMNSFSSDARKFGWGILVNVVPSTI